MKSCLRKLAAVIGMKVIADPVCFPYPWPGTRDGKALSAFCPLAESSITVHTHPERQYIFMNVFSCKEFSPEKLLEAVKQSFDMPNPYLWMLERGMNEAGECVPASMMTRR